MSVTSPDKDNICPYKKINRYFLEMTYLTELKLYMND